MPTSLRTLDAAPGSVPETRASVARTPSITSACARQISSPTATSAASSSAASCASSAASSCSMPDGNAETLLIATRSLARVVRARHPPAAADRSDDAVVGNEHVGQEDLVEQRLAGQLAQRSDAEAGRLHVDE